MGRLRTVSLILILGAWGGATEGAAPDDAAAAPSTATRQAPPAPPIKYLEAGAKLFNSEEFAGWPPSTWRRPIAIAISSATDEQKLLDAYLAELAKVQQAGMTSRPAGRPEGPGDRTRGRGGPDGGHGPDGRGGPGDGRRIAPPRWRRTRPPCPPARPRSSSADAGCSTRGASSSCAGNYDERPAEGRRGPHAGRPLGAVRRHAGQARAGHRSRPAQHGAGRPRTWPTPTCSTTAGPPGPGCRRPATCSNERPVRAGRGHRAGREVLGAVLQHVRGQSRQGDRGRPGPASPRQGPQPAGAPAGRPGASTTNWSRRPASS